MHTMYPSRPVKTGQAGHQSILTKVIQQLVNKLTMLRGGEEKTRWAYSLTTGSPNPSLVMVPKPVWNLIKQTDPADSTHIVGLSCGTTTDILRCIWPVARTRAFILLLRPPPSSSSLWLPPCLLLLLAHRLAMVNARENVHGVMLGGETPPP
jgi:hypothetical protein